MNPWYESLFAPPCGTNMTISKGLAYLLLMERMKRDMNDEELKDFSTNAKEWVQMYAQVFLAKDVTLYMHIFAKHVDQSIRVHGNISKYSQQSFEKLNDRITQWYFHCTNHRNISALTQIMNKQNRIEYLSATCQRELRHQITCSVCHEHGHNKRTCPHRVV